MQTKAGDASCQRETSRDGVLRFYAHSAGLLLFACSSASSNLVSFRPLKEADFRFRSWVETGVDVVGGLTVLTTLYPGAGVLVLPSAISWRRDEPLFMIAAVLTRRPSELALESPVESCFRFIPDVAGDFRDTSRCLFQGSRRQLKPPARQVRHRWFRKISSEPLHQS